MTTAEVKTMLEAITGFANKVVYWAWPEKEAPALPFICFFTPNANTFGADNKVYYQSNVFRVELYTLKKSESTETIVESALANNGIFYRKATEYIESEKCFMTVYEIEV